MNEEFKRAWNVPGTLLVPNLRHHTWSGWAG